MVATTDDDIASTITTDGDIVIDSISIDFNAISGSAIDRDRDKDRAMGSLA